MGLRPPRPQFCRVERGCVWVWVVCDCGEQQQVAADEPRKHPSRGLFAVGPSEVVKPAPGVSLSPPASQNTSPAPHLSWPVSDSPPRCDTTHANTRQQPTKTQCFLRSPSQAAQGQLTVMQGPQVVVVAEEVVALGCSTP